MDEACGGGEARAALTANPRMQPTALQVFDPNEPLTVRYDEVTDAQVLVLLLDLAEEYRQGVFLGVASVVERGLRAPCGLWIDLDEADRPTVGRTSQSSRAAARPRGDPVAPLAPAGLLRRYRASQ